MRQKRSLCSGMSPAHCLLSFFLFFFFHPRLLSSQPRSFFGGEMFSRPVAPFYLRSGGVRRRTAVLSPRSFLIIKTPQTSPFHHRPPSNIHDTAFGVSTALTKKKKKKCMALKGPILCKRINWVSEAPQKGEKSILYSFILFLGGGWKQRVKYAGFFWWGVLGLSI